MGDERATLGPRIYVWRDRRSRRHHSRIRVRLGLACSNPRRDRERALLFYLSGSVSAATRSRRRPIRCSCCWRCCRITIDGGLCRRCVVGRNWNSRVSRAARGQPSSTAPSDLRCCCNPDLGRRCDFCLAQAYSQSEWINGRPSSYRLNPALGWSSLTNPPRWLLPRLIRLRWLITP
jgi:hypothetical protein